MKQRTKPKQGFVLGDHQFLHWSVNEPPSRSGRRKRPIRGAKPPTCLDGFVRDSTPKSPSARDLYKGQFCGHGEFTWTVFDTVIDGVEVLEIGTITDSETKKNGRNAVLIAARKPKGAWVALFRRKWEDDQATLDGVRARKVTPAEARRIDPNIITGRVSIGFEYPRDADSRDVVSWMAIDVVKEGKRKSVCLLEAELA